MKIRSLGAFVAGVAIAIAFGVWAQAGYPTRPRFISVGIGVGAIPPTESGKLLLTGVSSGAQPVLGFDSTTPSLQMRESDAAANNRRWRQYVNGEQFVLDVVDDAGSGANWLTVDRTGTTVNEIVFSGSNFGTASNGLLSVAGTTARFRATDTTSAANSCFEARNNSAAVAFFCASNGASQVVTGDAAGDAVIRTEGATSKLWFSINGTSGAVDMTPEYTSTFTITYDNGFTTSPTQTARCYRVGNLVTITASAAMSATSNATTFDSTSTSIPTHCRPSASNAYGPNVGANNNGTSATAMVEIQSGEVVINRCGAVTGTCDGGSWTNTGTKGVDAWTISFIR